MRSFFATLRQLVLPGGALPGTPRIVIGPDVPAPLNTYHFFAGSGPMADAAIIFYQGGAGVNFNFLAHVSSGAGTFVWVGAVKNGAVVESSPNLPAGTSWDIATPGLGSSITHYLGGANGSDVQYVDTDGNYVSQPRGKMFFLADTAAANVANPNTSRIIGDAGATRYPNGRAFRMTAAGLWSNTVAGTKSDLRAVNGVNALISGPIPSTKHDTQSAWQVYVWLFKNSSGADISTGAGVTAQPAGGTVTFSANGSNAPRWLLIEDIGDSSIPEWAGLPGM
jgi:hypothetical protein